MVRSDLVVFARDATDAVRERPRLAVPFLVAAVVGAVADALRLVGPVPVRRSTVVTEGWLNVHTQPVPGVVSPVGTTPWATLGLAPGPLAGFAATAGVTALVGAAATVVVISQAPFGPDAGESLRRRVAWAAPQIVAFELLVYLAAAALTVAVASRGIVTYGAFLVATFLAGRTLLVPAAVTDGASLPRAVARSWRLTRRQPETFLVAVAAVGVAANLAVSLSAFLGAPAPVGTLVGTLAVGLPYALGVAAAAERLAE